MGNSSTVLSCSILIAIFLSSCTSKEDKIIPQDIPKSVANISVEQKSEKDIAIDTSGIGTTESNVSKVYTEIPVDYQGSPCILSDTKTPGLVITGTYNEMYQQNTYPIFAKDMQYAYFNNDTLKNNGKVINNADIQSFSVGDNELGLGSIFATDKDSLYFIDRQNSCVKMYPFSRDTFSKIVFQNRELFAKDQDNVYFLMVECGEGCFITTFHKIKGADPKSFEVLSNDWKHGAYSKDSKYVYRSIVTDTGSYTNMLEGANPGDFTITSIQ